MPFTKVWADTQRHDVCKSRNCRAPIVYAQNARTGNPNPFNRPLTAVVVERELGTGRELWTVDLAQSHFATCPDRARFRRAR